MNTDELEKFMNNKFRCIDSQLHTIEVAQEYFNDISKNYNKLQKQVKKFKNINKNISEKVEGAMLESLPEWREVITDKLKDMLLSIVKEGYLTKKEHAEIDNGTNKMCAIFGGLSKVINEKVQSISDIQEVIIKELHDQNLIPEHIYKKIGNMIHSCDMKVEKITKCTQEDLSHIDNSEIFLFEPKLLVEK